MPSEATSSVSYADLYSRWEESHWRATEIDFGRDRRDWEALGELQRRSMRWQFAMFFNGEDSVASNLSPYIDAAPTREQRYFLATQQVDEARHAVFFARFFDDVLGAGGTVAESLRSCEVELSWGYRRTFERLDRMADELRVDRSLPKFAQAIVLYHVVVEAALAQSGQHFISDYLDRMGIMPGLRSGMEHVGRDEQRHIGFGVKALSELFAASEECRAAAAEVLREVMPYALCVFVPPGFDRRYTEELGFTLEEIYGFGFRSFESKLRAAGLPADQLPPGVLPVDFSVTPEERGARMLKLLEAGLIADPTTKPQSTPDAQRLLFDTVERSVDTGAVDGRPLTIQWRFSDAAPWHLRIANGSVRADQGEAPAPDLTLETTWCGWVRLSIWNCDPLRAMLERRLKPHGSLRALWRLRKVFPTGSTPRTRSARRAERPASPARPPERPTDACSTV